MDECKELSRMAIGLTSITSIAFATAGILSDEKKKTRIDSNRNRRLLLT